MPNRSRARPATGARHPDLRPHRRHASRQARPRPTLPYQAAEPCEQAPHSRRAPTYAAVRSRRRNRRYRAIPGPLSTHPFLDSCGRRHNGHPLESGNRPCVSCRTARSATGRHRPRPRSRPPKQLPSTAPGATWRRQALRRGRRPTGTSTGIHLAHTAELREFPVGRSFVAAAEEAITLAGDAIAEMKYFTVSELPPAQVCREKVAEADIVMVIAGFRYGSPVADEPHHSHTELEFDTAIGKQIPTWVFLLGDQVEGPAAMFCDGENCNCKRQAEFRRRLRDTGRVVATVNEAADLTTKLYQALVPSRHEQGGPTVHRVDTIPIGRKNRTCGPTGRDRRDCDRGRVRRSIHGRRATIPTVQGDIRLLTERSHSSFSSRGFQHDWPTSGAMAHHAWCPSHLIGMAARSCWARHRTPRRSKCWPTAHRWPSPSTATRCRTRY